MTTVAFKPKPGLKPALQPISPTPAPTPNRSYSSIAPEMLSGAVSLAIKNAGWGTLGSTLGAYVGNVISGYIPSIVTYLGEAMVNSMIEGASPAIQSAAAVAKTLLSFAPAGTVSGAIVGYAVAKNFDSVRAYWNEKMRIAPACLRNAGLQNHEVSEAAADVIDKLPREKQAKVVNALLTLKRNKYILGPAISLLIANAKHPEKVAQVILKIQKKANHGAIWAQHKEMFKMSEDPLALAKIFFSLKDYSPQMLAPFCQTNYSASHLELLAFALDTLANKNRIKLIMDLSKGAILLSENPISFANILSVLEASGIARNPEIFPAILEALSGSSAQNLKATEEAIRALERRRQLLPALIPAIASSNAPNALAQIFFLHITRGLRATPLLETELCQPKRTSEAKLKAITEGLKAIQPIENAQKMEQLFGAVLRSAEPALLGTSIGILQKNKIALSGALLSDLDANTKPMGQALCTLDPEKIVNEDTLQAVMSSSNAQRMAEALVRLNAKETLDQKAIQELMEADQYSQAPNYLNILVEEIANR